MDLSVHKAWIDEENVSAVFPLYNLNKQFLGYQRYRPNKTKEYDNDPREGRYFTRLKDGKFGVWGLESWHFSNTLFVTEGIFDACRVTKLGASAIAMLSNDPKHLTDWFFILRQLRPVVMVCDAGTPGKKLAKYGTHSITVPEEYGDLGDAPEKYVKELINGHTS